MLNVDKLQAIKQNGSRITARCPACAEEGRDRKGNHLFIYPDGRFGCVLHQGENGHNHRKRIFELCGKPCSGTLGTLNSNSIYKNGRENRDRKIKAVKTAVPNVPRHRGKENLPNSITKGIFNKGAF